MNPIALVTGGAIRVGRRVALGLADAGYDLIVQYRSSADAAEEVEALVTQRGHRCALVQADLGKPEDIERLGAEARERFGRLDVLVNSAANFRSTSLLEIDADEWDSVLNVNLRGPHLLVREVADLLKASGGVVVNIADHMGMKPWVTFAHHSISKAGVIHLTRIQARALAPEVRVNAIAPGLVLPPDGMDGEALEREIDATLLKRVGSADDVAGAVLYLVRASYVTGQLLVVDGGGSLLE